MLQREFQHNSTHETGLQVVQVMNDALNMRREPLAASPFVFELAAGDGAAQSLLRH